MARHPWRAACALWVIGWACLCGAQPQPLHKQEDKGASAIAKHVVAMAPAGQPRAALKVFDIFSSRHRLGMHLGEEKGRLIEKAVRQAMPKTGPVTVLETGCHAGDGSLRAAVVASEREGSMVVSTEANTQWLAAAKDIVSHATSGLSEFSFLPLELGEGADFGEFLDMLQDKHGVTRLDTVILDQDQTRFASQVRLMLERGLLRQGSTIYVDNVKTKKPQLREYIEMVKGAHSQSWQTMILDVKRPYEDAVAISTYVGGSSEL